MQGAEVTLKELARLEQSMYRLTAVAMSPTKSQAESGFAKLLDRSQSDSQLAVLVQSLEDCLNKAIKYASGYRTDKYPEISVTISKNFIPVKLHSQQVMALKTLFKDSGVMPVRLLYEMLEAGEMFEGLHNFSINDTLERMGLTGNETAVDIHGAKEKPAVDDESLIDDESVINREDSDPETDESSLETREN
jgi:hypothetical protein